MEALLTDEFLDLLVDRLLDRLRSRMVKELDLLNPIMVEAERAVPGKNIRNGRNATLHGPKMEP